MNRLFKALVSGTAPAFLVTGGLGARVAGAGIPPGAAPLASTQPASAATASAPAVKVPADFPQQFAVIRQQLASDDFAQREAGQKALDGLSPDLLEALQAVADKENDPEVKARLDMRLDTMAGWRLTHPPPLSVAFKDAPLSDIVAELNRQLGAPLIVVRAPPDNDRFTVVAQNKPLMGILADLDRQSPLTVTGTANAPPLGLPTLDLGRGRGRDLRTFENFAFTTWVTSQADGTWRVMVTGVADPRIRVMQITPLHIDKMTDQDGRSLLTALAGGLTSGTGHPLANWSSMATVEPVAGVQSIKEFRGSVTFSVLEREETAVFDLTKPPAPIKTSHGVISVEQVGGAGGKLIATRTLIVRLGPTNGAVPAVVAPTAPRFDLTIRSFNNQNQLVSTSMLSTAGAHSNIDLPGEATRVEVSWAAKTRDVVIPIEGKDLPVPPPVPVPAPVPAGPMPVDGVRR